MALQDIAQVSITLSSSGVQRAGFGIPFFLTAHNYFTDRVRTYTDSTTIGTDTQTTSNAFLAGQSVFSNEPSVDNLKIARLIGDSLISPLVTVDGSVVTGTTAAMTVTVTDTATPASGGTVVITYTTSGGDTVADVVTSLVAQIDAALLSLDVTNNGDTFTITREGTGSSEIYPIVDYVLSDFTNIGITATAVEDAVTGLTAIQLLDDDWYALFWEQHDTLADIQAMATYIETLDKLYFYGSEATESISTTYTPGSDPSSTNDILGYLAEGGYMRTIGWWHHEADTSFNEGALLGYNLPFDAGSITWANIQVPVSSAKNSDGVKLTPTQEQHLADRYANWAAITGSTVYNREGKVVGNEWIDIIRGRDNLKSDLTADIFDILTNQQGTKVPYTDKGINVFSSAIERRLNDYKVNRVYLTDPITITVPVAADIPSSEKVTRILDGLEFTATLAGAIQLVEVTGKLEV
ncbi:MAG: DUF3383 domain-containing protein [Alphaproteobacteria bacterium]|nr:DUF3383 domain-containing protein [Alphaproteobacteria bacterium]